MNLLYSMQEYSPSYGANKTTNLSNIFVADLQYKFTPSFSNSWVAIPNYKGRSKGLDGSSVGNKFCSGMGIYGSDMYNHGKKIKSIITMWEPVMPNPVRVALSYGRNKEGYVCSGGVCRTIPKYTGG